MLPTEELGRVNGALAALFGAMLPLGALVSGPLAEILGVRAALVIGLVGTIVAPISVLFSPVARLSAMPKADSAP